MVRFPSENKKSFLGLVFEGLYFATVYDGCRRKSLSYYSDRVFSLDAEVKLLRKLGQNVHIALL